MVKKERIKLEDHICGRCGREKPCKYKPEIATVIFACAFFMKIVNAKEIRFKEFLKGG